LSIELTEWSHCDRKVNISSGRMVNGPDFVARVHYILYTAGGINKAEDLKGKRVGVSGLGGVTHFAMIYALKKLGLNPETDATMTVIGSAGARLAAVVSGTVAATLVQPPESLKAGELGLKPMLNLTQSGIRFPSNQLAVTVDTVRNHRDLIKRFLMGSIAGLGKLKSDRQFTIKSSRNIYVFRSRPCSRKPTIFG
jgi:ABC-type nitrate/sulfonate/bicarbonate transport system substrate-binding protein